MWLAQAGIGRPSNEKADPVLPGSAVIGFLSVLLPPPFTRIVTASRSTRCRPAETPTSPAPPLRIRVHGGEHLVTDARGHGKFLVELPRERGGERLARFALAARKLPV